MHRLDPVSLEILWRRLIATTNEMATVLVRTSFSTVISAANDFACELMDARGRSLAHAARSMPVFNQTMPHVTGAVLDHYGDDVNPGDVFITNDAWLNAGHYPDIAVITPFFRDGQLKGFAASVAHAADIGGTLDPDRARESYEEGLLIPICRLYEQGELQQVVVDFIAGNVRASDAVIGDIHAQVAANRSGADSVLALLDEYGLPDLTDLADTIQERSESAMREAITRVPDGVYRSHVTFDEYDGPLEIRCAIEVDGDQLRVDYAGSSPQQPQGGLNCTEIYTRGQTSYGLKCILLPEIPSNAGVYRPISIDAPEASVLNARKPASVQMRTRTGWYVHQALFSALAEVLPEQVMAPAGLLSAWMVYGQPRLDAPGFHAWFFNAGGMGAGSHTDGVSTCIYPSSASTVSIELFEVAVPMLIRQKELVTDSGGAGRQRGGLGQRVEFSLLPSFDGEATVSMWVHGRNYPPFGLHGGHPAAATQVEIDGVPAHSGLSGMVVSSSETVLAQSTAGGGGFGPPEERDREALAEDVRNGYVSAQQARDVYGMTEGEPRRGRHPDVT